jgi:hypothetical protein
MLAPKVCPVCASDELEPILRKPLSTKGNTAPDPVSGVLAYRCSNGHLFTVSQDDPHIDRKAAGS